MIKVLLADDHSIMRAGLRRIIEESDDIEVIAEAEADMKRYEEGAALANPSRFVEARDKFDEATALYEDHSEDHDEDDDDEDHEEMDEGEGLKPAPAPEKHDATGSRSQH